MVSDSIFAIVKEFVIFRASQKQLPFVVTFAFVVIFCVAFHPVLGSVWPTLGEADSVYLKKVSMRCVDKTVIV